MFQVKTKQQDELDNIKRHLGPSSSRNPTKALTNEDEIKECGGDACAEGNRGVPCFHKLAFPMFDGKEDPLP